jgi:hypothetical protein
MKAPYFVEFQLGDESLILTALSNRRRRRASFRECWDLAVQIAGERRPIELKGPIVVTLQEHSADIQVGQRGYGARYRLPIEALHDYLCCREQEG